MNAKTTSSRQGTAASKRAGGKAGGERTLGRRLALLSLLPGGTQAGLRVDALARKLADAGFRCTTRTVERDLAAIRDEQLWCDEGIEIASAPDPSDRRARLWSYRTAKKPLLLGSRSIDDAMLVGLMAQELQAFLPASTLQVLSAYQPGSEGTLRHPGHGGHARFRQKIRSVPDGPLTIPPPIDLDHLRTINEALLREEQIDLRYRAASRDGAEIDYRLHPVGMVKKGLVFWLIAFKEKPGSPPEGPRTFRMERVVSVARREHDPVSRALPQLQQVLDDEVLQYFPKGPIRMALRSVPGNAGDRLIENYLDTPFSRDQRITRLDQGGHLLEATVRHTRELVWMLQGQAHLLEVLEPPALRQELQHFAALVAQRYGALEAAQAQTSMNTG